MTRFLMTAVGCALLLGSGLVPARAQAQPSDDDRAPRERGEPRAYRDGRGGWGWDDRDGWRARRELGESGGSRGGAQFWLRSGDTRLGVRCDPGEPVRACIDAATTLLEKVRSLPPAAAPATPAPSPGAGAPLPR